MGLVAKKMKVKLPDQVAIDAEIDLCNFWRWTTARNPALRPAREEAWLQS